MFVGMDKFGKNIFGNYLDIRNIRNFYASEISHFTVGLAAANSCTAKAMEMRQQKQESGKPRGEYWVYSGKEKAEIAKRAAVYGVSATINIMQR